MGCCVCRLDFVGSEGIWCMKNLSATRKPSLCGPHRAPQRLLSVQSCVCAAPGGWGALAHSWAGRLKGRSSDSISYCFGCIYTAFLQDYFCFLWSFGLLFFYLSSYFEVPNSMNGYQLCREGLAVHTWQVGLHRLPHMGRIPLWVITG